MKRKLQLWQTAGFSERSHNYFMKITNNNINCLNVMNRPFAWWGCYRYRNNPAYTRYFETLDAL